MKISRFLGFLAGMSLSIPLVDGSASAQESRPHLRQNPRSTLDSNSAGAYGTGDGSQAAESEFSFGVGGTTWGSTLSAVPLSLWMDVNSANSIQVALGLGDIQPFKLHAGAAYRLTVDGDARMGFHVGLGSQLLLNVVGTVAGFDFRLLPLFGFHGRIPGLQKIGASVDLGAECAISDNGTVEISAGALSPALGLSVHYFF